MNQLTKTGNSLECNTLTTALLTAKCMNFSFIKADYEQAHYASAAHLNSEYDPDNATEQER